MLSEAGVDVTVFFHSDALQGRQAERTEAPYKVVRFCDSRLSDGSHIVAPLGGFIGAAYQINAFLADYRSLYGDFDVVEFQDYGATSYFYLKEKWLYRFASSEKVILTAHRPYFHAAWTDDASVHDHTIAFLGDLERWCYRAADAVFAPCEFIVNALAHENFNFTSDHMHVVYNPYRREPTKSSLEAQMLGAELRRSIGGPNKPVLFFGKLQAQKGVKELLKSLSALWDKGFAHPLSIFGRDALDTAHATGMLEALRKQFARHFVEGRVRYLGSYSQSLLEEIGAEHPIIAAPFREECLPYAFIEALQGGALPVFRREGGQVELTPEHLHEALIADFSSPGGLQHCLSNLFSWNGEKRRAISTELKAFCSQKIGYEQVLASKLKALQSVKARPQIETDYPFVYQIPPEVSAHKNPLGHTAPVNGEITSVTYSNAYLDAPLTDRDKLISVVIPFFEMQDYLDETLYSVFNSVYKNVEAVIVDDGSHSPAAKRYLSSLLDRFKSRHVMLVEKFNGGLSDARNAGANCATGEYLYFLDADDTIHPRFLGEAAQVLFRAKNVSYVGAWLKEFGLANGRWVVWDVDSPYICFHNVQICSFLTRKKPWLEYGYNDQKMTDGLEDYESHIRMFAAGVRGISIPRYYFNYRIRQNSMSRGFNPHMLAYLYRVIMKKHKRLFRHFGDVVAGLLAENGHGALAGPPNIQTNYYSATFGSPAGLSLATEGAAHELACSTRIRDIATLQLMDGSNYTSYILAQNLLVLGLYPEYCANLFRAARNAKIGGGWAELFGSFAAFRIGAFSYGQDCCRQAIKAGADGPGHAAKWHAQLECVLGYPHSARAVYQVLRSAELGVDTVDTGFAATAGWGEPFAFAELEDARFGVLFQKLWDARLAVKRNGPRMPLIVKDLAASYRGLLSTEAAGRSLGRWLLWWWSVDARAEEEIGGALASIIGELPAEFAAATLAAVQLRGVDVCEVESAFLGNEVRKLLCLGRATSRNQIAGPVISARQLPNPVSVNDWHVVRQIMSGQLCEVEIAECLRWAYSTRDRVRVRAWLEYNLGKISGDLHFVLPEFGKEDLAARKISDASRSGGLQPLLRIVQNDLETADRSLAVARV